MKTFLDRLLGQAEEINGHNRCPTYLYRWTIMRTRWFKVYLHKFVGDDWSIDLHDHPKRFISIGIWGSYMEETETDLNGSDNFFGRTVDFIRRDGVLHRRCRFTAPWFRTFPASHKHRISTPWGNCWTLVIVGQIQRDWGFWHDGKFYGWKAYVEGAGGIADKMKACK